MSDKAILEWLGGRDTGLSSKALAIAALGAVTADAKHHYPHDGADFGRCYRLLLAAPAAQAGLNALAADGGPAWQALIAKWDEIGSTYVAEMAGGKRGSTYELMRSILAPIEAADRSRIDMGGGVSMRMGA